MAESNTPLEALKTALAANDLPAVRAAMSELSLFCIEESSVPQAFVNELLTLLSKPAMFTSAYSGYLLNFFEFEASRLSSSQKSEVRLFISRLGGMFTHVHSQQVVTELKHGSYLC